MFDAVDEIAVESDGVTRRIVLGRGDLARIDPAQGVDLLVVSALPGDYAATRGSIIGQLADRGVSVADLAQEKARDLRATSGAWLSQPVEGAGFRRLVCFEPARIGPPPEVVGRLFRALFPFLGDDRDRVVAMPVVATGEAGWPVATVMPPLLEAAVEWLRLGLPVSTLWIVARSDEAVAAMQAAFDAERARQADAELAERRRRTEEQRAAEAAPPSPAAASEGVGSPAEDASLPEAAARGGWVRPSLGAAAAAASVAVAGLGFVLGGRGEFGMPQPSVTAPGGTGGGGFPEAIVVEPPSGPDPAVLWLLLVAGVAIAAVLAMRHLANRRRSGQRTSATPVSVRRTGPPEAPLHVDPRGPMPAAPSGARQVFLSFSSKDAEAADRVVAAFRVVAPQVRIFDFRRDIDLGVAYQREVDRALERSDRALCLMSPDYMVSGECLEELMVARLRNKRSGFTYLWPVYWRDVPDGLELWLQVLNYADCRECDAERLEDAIRRLVSQLSSGAAAVQVSAG